MAAKQFEPKFMKISVLTAALQELTPREIRDKDPDRAIEEWLQFARDVGSDNIELSAALHPTESDIPADAMLDPVANTLDLRQAEQKLPSPSFEDGYKNQRVLDAIERSARDGKWVKIG